MYNTISLLQFVILVDNRQLTVHVFTYDYCTAKHLLCCAVVVQLLDRSLVGTNSKAALPENCLAQEWPKSMVRTYVVSF